MVLRFKVLGFKVLGLRVLGLSVHAPQVKKAAFQIVEWGNLLTLEFGDPKTGVSLRPASRYYYYYFYYYYY